MVYASLTVNVLTIKVIKKVMFPNIGYNPLYLGYCIYLLKENISIYNGLALKRLLPKIYPNRNRQDVGCQR